MTVRSQSRREDELIALAWIVQTSDMIYLYRILWVELEPFRSQVLKAVVNVPSRLAKHDSNVPVGNV